jgi:hypothetical protein
MALVVGEDAQLPNLLPQARGLRLAVSFADADEDEYTALKYLMKYECIELSIAEDEKQLLSTLEELPFDGVILAPPFSNSNAPELIRNLRKRAGWNRLPVVVFVHSAAICGYFSFSSFVSMRLVVVFVHLIRQSPENARSNVPIASLTVWSIWSISSWEISFMGSTICASPPQSRASSCPSETSWHG